ncbi:hypothetical protein Bca4012_056207 [Brassica carinata]
MDPSIFKLLEEEDDEDESLHSKEDVDAFQASLIREIDGGNHSWSQFAASNSGSRDANTNNFHVLESTQMKEQQQQPVLGNKDRELKPEDESHSQHNLPQNHLQPGRLCENPSHVPQESNLQSRNKSISTEPESPQPLYLKLLNTCVQRPHGLEQPVGSVNLGPTQLQVCQMFRLLIPQVGKDRGKQLNTLYYKFKSNEVTKENFLRQVRKILGDRMTLWAVRKLQQQGDKEVKVPDGPNHYRESFTSADQSLIRSLTEDNNAKKSDSCGVHVNQLPSTSSGTLSSSATVHELHNSERPTSVNCPSMVQGGSIFHFQTKSSLPLYSAPCQGPVTKDQTMSNDQTVAHVKHKLTDQSFDQVREPCSLVRQDVSNVPMEQSNGNPRRDLVKQSSEMILSASTKTQLDSSTMVNFSAPVATIPPGTIVRTTQGQRKTLEAQGSSLPPLSKRQKLCETSLAPSDKKFNDVTELSGINLMEEERELLSSLPKKNSRVLKSFRRVAHEEEGRTILQKVPLQRKLAELSWCVEERMRKLLCNIIRMSKQRTDPEKCRDRICITSDIRKQINEMNKEKEEQGRQYGGEEKLKNDTAKEDKRSEQLKATKEQAEKRAKAANDAALASVGGDNVFLKWKLMAEACGGRLGKNQGSPKVVRSISVKDVIAVVKKEPQMSRSTLLYRLYNRIGSDVPTQDMIRNY